MINEFIILYNAIDIAIINITYKKVMTDFSGWQL